MTSMTIGFAGLGLIGGSIAKALRRVHPDYKLIAYDTNKESLIQALADGVLNETCDSISTAFSSCNIIFLCAPVSINIKHLEILKPFIKDNCILTDVGSVKTSIHEAVRNVGLSSHFVGGHPMAGAETSGYASASDRLLENAYYILTPSHQAPHAYVETMEQLVRDIVSVPIVLHCQEHDKITAAISHLPHIIAYNLVNLVRENDNAEGMMRMLAAGGFKDITRIASSSPIMWQQICSENTKPILQMIDTYMTLLEHTATAIKNNDKDYLMNSFTNAKNYRDDIPVSKIRSVLKPAYEIYVDLIDESGAIATIATILATNTISIKNIGIVHNREFQDGVLKIEFYEDDAVKKATELLRKFHYVVHERN